MDVHQARADNPTRGVDFNGAALRVLPVLAGAQVVASTPLLVGGGVALVSGVVAIWAFLRLLRSGAFYKFAWYVVPAGLLALALL